MAPKAGAGKTGTVGSPKVSILSKTLNQSGSCFWAASHLSSNIILNVFSRSWSRVVNPSCPSPALELANVNSAPSLACPHFPHGDLTT